MRAALGIFENIVNPLPINSLDFQPVYIYLHEPVWCIVYFSDFRHYPVISGALKVLLLKSIKLYSSKYWGSNVVHFWDVLIFFTNFGSLGSYKVKTCFFFRYYILITLNKNFLLKYFMKKKVKKNLIFIYYRVLCNDISVELKK